jgi:hypothetical protein
VVALLLTGGYANGLNAAFVFDDEPAIVDNTSIRSLWPLWPVLTPATGMGSTQDGRPLYNLSLAVNYAMHGLWRPGYRIVNLLLHLLNACLVFDITRRLQAVSHPDRDGMAERRDGWLAAGVALLWAVHPLHAHVVTYAAQRAESLAASFILGACDAAIVALVHGSAGAAAIAAVCAVGGGLAKETTAAILPLVGGFHWAYRDRLPATLAAGGRRLAVVLYAGLALNLLTLAAVRYGLGGRGDTAAADRLLSAAVSSAAKRGVAETVARACDEAGEFAAAARLWEPLAAADPALLANLAVSRMEAGQTDAAIVAFAEAVRRFPNNQGMRDNLQRAQGIAAARARVQSSAEGR